MTGRRSISHRSFPQTFPPHAYLNAKVEEVQVPIGSRNHEFVYDSHADRRQTVGEDRRAGAVVDLVKVGFREYRAALAAMARGPEERFLVAAKVLPAIEAPHLNILILLVRHLV